MTEMAQGMQDPLILAAKNLGEAKAHAAKKGLELINIFEGIKKEVTALKEHGISVTTIEFEDDSLQAAWNQFASDGKWGEMPLMPTEHELVERARLRSVS